MWKFHQGLETLCLHEWRLSRVSSERRAFRRRLHESQLQTSGASLQPCKWTRFLGCCDRQGVYPSKATIPQVAEYFLFLRQELGLSVLAGKGYLAALTGMGLTGSSVVSWMFRSFQRSCLPWEIRPPDWNLFRLRCFSRPLFQPLKLAADKHLDWKMSFLLALVLAKRVSELHGLSFRVHHLCSWKFGTFSFLPY